MTTRRATAARQMAAHALTFHPAAPPPRFAVRALVEAIATDFHDGDPTEAVLALLDDRDDQFDQLLLLGAGVGLGAADPVPHAAAALEDHRGQIRLATAIGDTTVPLAQLLARLVGLVALVHHAGDRRAAMRAMVADGDDLFAALFQAVVGVVF